MRIVKNVIVIFVIILVLLISLISLADDNADSGSGDTDNAIKDRGFYRGSEYMYKVSVYVGLSDKSNKSSNLNKEWTMIGSESVYVKPAGFSLSSNVFYGNHSKGDYINGEGLASNMNPKIITDNPPPIPITNGGSINSVKSYFGDTRTLLGLIDAFASQKGITREGVVSNITFTVDGETKKYPANEILPIKTDGKYQNKVPWLIIYEPVIISYLKDRTTILAFTATEYALAQKLGYFNFKYGSTGQHIAAMTHSDLPNSIILEESWFGYSVTSALPDGVHWNEDRIILGGGWGMRMLKANAINVIDNDVTYDYEYRVNTNVITSVRIYANGDITPDNRHKSELDYKNPRSNTAIVTMKANGYSKSTEVVIPSGDGKNDYCPGHIGYKWVDIGRWADNGKFVDEGNWYYDYTNYQAAISASIDLYADKKVPTANGNTMKSGYGVNIDISTSVYSNAPSSHLTSAQNVISYFPEFKYKNYWRLLDMASYGNFEFKKNKYSTYNNRVHFTPLWYPDEKYTVYSEVIDMWTPDGMLRINLNDYVNIKGNLYEDWHIGKTK